MIKPLWCRVLHKCVTPKILLTLFLFTLMISVSWAQQISVKGKVVDADNQPIAGASVQVKGNSTLTGPNGTFEVTAEQGDVLKVTFVGYRANESRVASVQPMTITLINENNDLDEVVVIGYGTARKRDLTGAVGTAKADDTRNVPVTTAAQAITGKVAGVNVVTQSGAPGAGVNILVRGGTSITGGTSPLYVVDGFVMEDALMKIDINDVESIDILKDASATAIYGARGANGVVQVTTKSG